uniref:cache domain-containing protein n=1 Tax=Helicobacter mesocricetorum TaxID=87012 RepID=UPI0018F82F3F
MFKSLNIGSKLILSVSIAIVIGLVILIAIVSSRVSTNIISQVRQTLEQSSVRYANKMEGALNESISLIAGLTNTINDEIKANDITLSRIEELTKDIFDSSSYATYAFLYLEDESILGNSNVISKYRSEAGSFGMIFSDSDTSKPGGIEPLQFTEVLKNFPLMQQLRNQMRTAPDRYAILVGNPNRFNINQQKEFVGINIATPIISRDGRYIGAIAFMFNLENFAKYLLNEKLDLYDGDTRALITQDGIIAVHKNNSIVLRNLQEVNNTPQTRAILDAIKANSSQIFEDYVTTTGEESFAALASFKTIRDSSSWSILVTSPESSVLESLYNLQLLLILFGIIFLVVIIAVIYYCIQTIVAKRLPILSNALETFFRFLNHEKVDPKPLKINANDEIGKMGTIINQNIISTKKGLEQD